MKSLVLAEKPSVARDIARVLNCRSHRRQPICRYMGAGPSCNPCRPGRIRSEVQRMEPLLPSHDSEAMEPDRNKADIQTIP